MFSDTDLRYTHEPISDSETLCGISMDEVPLEVALPMACDCGCPDCEHPLTCPACIALLIGGLN